MGRIGVEGFIEYDDQKPVLLKSAVIQQGLNVVLQPSVCVRELNAIRAILGAIGTIVGIISGVGDDEGKIWQLIVGEIGTELGEWDQIGGLRRAYNIREIGKRVVMF